MWSDSKGRGVVYLSTDPSVAYSYAEEAEWLDSIEDPDIYLDNIVVLKIDTSKLDKEKLFKDDNVLTDEDMATIDGWYSSAEETTENAEQTAESEEI